MFNGHHDKNLKDTGVSFSPDNTYLNELLADLTMLSGEDREKLEVDIDIDELESIIIKCANNKSPGLDGLSYEFYKCTWSVIKDTLLSVLQCQLKRNRLILSDTCGATRLISKVDGIPNVDELRPITLLNCDYKICAKVLVQRMKPVLPKVIRSSQLCSVGSKNILFGVFNILSSILAINQKKVGACLLSLDFFKAYDRVYLKFLFVVMKKMGFGDKFITWIDMLHADAKTCFLLANLTDPILLSFSIRQGDPLAMLLYIIYIEPLLVYIGKRVSGLQVLHPLQGGTEAYCDDINVITASDDDLIIVGEGVQKFEAVSGAILSRNQKCKILGIGKWSKRDVWPLNFVKTVQEVKVFGVFMLNSYAAILKRNWDYRYRKFEQAVYSWSSRMLEHLCQRIDVLRIYALSRVFYLASILPISKTLGKKFEKLTGKFIWSFSGKILKLSLNDLKLPLDRGGLKLTCVHFMSKSSILTQLLRLAKYGDSKSRGHASFWLGEILEDLDPDLNQYVHPKVVPAYFQNLAEIITDARIADLVTSNNWKIITNKFIYHSYLKTLPDSKTEVEADAPLSDVWKRLGNASLSAEVKEVLYLLVHNKLPTKERLFRIKTVHDPYCGRCENNEIGDRVHYFCSCNSVIDAWNSVSDILSVLLGQTVSQSELITLRFPKSHNDTEVTWLIGVYIYFVWKTFQGERKDLVDRDQLFGFLKYKYKSDQLGSRSPLNIPNL